MTGQKTFSLWFLCDQANISKQECPIFSRSFTFKVPNWFQVKNRRSVVYQNLLNAIASFIDNDRLGKCFKFEPSFLYLLLHFWMNFEQLSIIEVHQTLILIVFNLQISLLSLKLSEIEYSNIWIFPFEQTLRTTL